MFLEISLRCSSNPTAAQTAWRNQCSPFRDLLPILGHTEGALKDLPHPTPFLIFPVDFFYFSRYPFTTYLNTLSTLDEQDYPACSRIGGYSIPHVSTKVEQSLVVLQLSGQFVLRLILSTA